MISPYTTPFGITSQFAFCGLPLRLDTYRGCGFQCTYCFARYRGGNTAGNAIVPANPMTVRRIIDRSLHSDRSHIGVVGEFLRRRTPVHLGGMSDPFQVAEKRYGVTRAVLEVLRHYAYPTVISTRGTLVGEEPYLDLLKGFQPLVVQFSFSTTLDAVAPRIEPQCSPPSTILRVMERLSAAGVQVTCRWQPYVPGVSEQPRDFVRRVSSTGCRHLALEHLKLPLERGNPLWPALVAGIGRDIHSEYRGMGAKRDGRELILPAREKVSTVVGVAAAVHACGMTFGAADNEFQYLSDTECCCSGVDQFPGFQSWFRHQIGYAMRRCRDRAITYGVIAKEWTPRGSIDRFLNSRSRLSTRTNRPGTIQEHVRDRWNSLDSQGGPASFFGVLPTQRRVLGARVYEWAQGGANDLPVERPCVPQGAGSKW